MDALSALLKKNLQSLALKHNEKLQRHCRTILEETYCKVPLKSDSVTDVCRVLMRGRQIFYKKYDSSKVYRFPTMSKGNLVVPNDILIEGSYFDSIDVEYSDFSHLQFGDKTITVEDDSVFDRYRITHHLGEKIFFLGYRSSDTIVYGNLYAADLSSSTERQIIAEKVDLNFDITDLCVDQYTGDIILCTVQCKIYVLQKLRYVTQVKDMITGESNQSNQREPSVSSRGTPH